MARRSGQQRFEFRTWGGKREGAGRKQVNERKSQPHRRREELDRATGFHVTLRVAPDVRRMRRMDAYRAVHKAMTVVLARADFRIVHASIQANHVHLVVEADSKLGLARGMQGFQISAAKRLNQIDTDRRGRVRRGAVFVDRYHAEALTSPTRARRALAYVLNNWRRHQEDRVCETTRSWLLDRYSSAVRFAGWKEPFNWILPDDYSPLPVVTPQTWLLREGWKRGGGPISIYEKPGPR